MYGSCVRGNSLKWVRLARGKDTSLFTHTSTPQTHRWVQCPKGNISNVNINRKNKTLIHLVYWSELISIGKWFTNKYIVNAYCFIGAKGQIRRVRMPEHLELHQLVDGSTYANYKARLIRSCSCPYLGIILATLSSLFFSLCSVIVKGLVDINPIELASYR